MSLIGNVMKMNVNGDGKASGRSYVPGLAIEISKLLHRGVLLRISRLEDPRWFEVQYERLPFYYFMGGIMRHSEIECPRNKLASCRIDV